MSLPTSILDSKASYSKDKLYSFLLVIKYVSQRLGYASSITLNTNGSVLPVPGNSSHAFVSNGYYSHLSTISLFQEVVTTNFLCFCSASVTLPIRLSNPLFGNPLFLTINTLSYPCPLLIFLKPVFSEKKLALSNLTTI